MGTQKQPKHSKDSTLSTKASKDSAENTGVQDSDSTLSTTAPEGTEDKTCAQDDEARAEDDTRAQDSDTTSPFSKDSIKTITEKFEDYR